MSDGDRDARRFPRVPVRLVVEYDDADDFLSDYTENLSSGGTFILTSRRLERETVVDLVLSFPGLVQPISIGAVVRWSRGGAHPGVGVEFQEGPDRARLDALVAALHAGDQRIVAKVIRVLVAEDNPHIAELLCTGLGASAKRMFGEALAFRCARAMTGSEAVELLRTDQFDVAIIDVYMPGLDGVRVIALARRDLGLSDLPIIAIASGDESARATALDAGADAFLEKPMQLRAVIDSMRRLLPLPAAPPGVL